MIEKALFYFFAAILVFSALRVVSVRNPVHASLFLILTFFTASALWLLLEAEFLAIVSVLVYVGAVMVLFLFVVMMLNINTEELHAEFVRYLPVGIVVGLVVIAEIVAVLWKANIGSEMPKAAPAHGEYSNTAELGKLIYGDYLFAFEIAAAVLLVALIAAVALVFRERRDVKRQDISKQVRVQAKDRMHLVDLERVQKGDSDD